MSFLEARREILVWASGSRRAQCDINLHYAIELAQRHLLRLRRLGWFAVMVLLTDNSWAQMFNLISGPAQRCGRLAQCSVNISLRASVILISRGNVTELCCHRYRLLTMKWATGLFLNSFQILASNSTLLRSIKVKIQSKSNSTKLSSTSTCGHTSSSLVITSCLRHDIAYLNVREPQLDCITLSNSCDIFLLVGNLTSPKF